MLPSWYVAALLALAAFRITRLTGWDDFPPVAKIRGLVVGERIEQSGTINAKMGVSNEPVEYVYKYRWPLLAHALHCAYCAGFWWCCGIYVAWVLSGAPGAVHYHSWLFYAATPFALNAVVGTWARMLDP